MPHPFGLFPLIFLLLTSCLEPGNTKNPANVVIAMADALQKKHPSIPVILPEEVKPLPHVVLVDVREKYESDVSTIPNAITRDEFEKDERKYINHEIITYCTIGVRSTEYARNLISKGHIAFNLKGGILAWAHAGYFFESEGKMVKKVHIFNKAWNLLPKDYEGVLSK